MILRPAEERQKINGKENTLQATDPARVFRCTKCPDGERLATSTGGLSHCTTCGADCANEKLVKVEEHLRNYIEQLEEVIAEAEDDELPSLTGNVTCDPAGLALLSQDHYLKLRLSLARAKYWARLGNLETAQMHWDTFSVGADRLALKLNL